MVSFDFKFTKLHFNDILKPTHFNKNLRHFLRVVEGSGKAMFYLRGRRWGVMQRGEVAR